MSKNGSEIKKKTPEDRLRQNVAEIGEMLANGQLDGLATLGLEIQSDFPAMLKRQGARVRDAHEIIILMRRQLIAGRNRYRERAQDNQHEVETITTILVTQLEFSMETSITLFKLMRNEQSGGHAKRAYAQRRRRLTNIPD